MIKLVRSNSKNPDFVALVRQLDQYLATVDGEDHEFYNRYNHIDQLDHVVIAYEEDKPVACGAMKAYGEEAMELKRMYTLPEQRGRGIASSILAELENWARELACSKCILETGKKQVEAIALYQKKHYRLIDNYEQYAGVENSLCFEKQIS